MNSLSWWRDAAIYQIYPRSFRDSNGDGEGDIAGVISELDYLAALGVDAIWLSPFYTSPNRDGGYDVADPRDVDPRFGNLADAKELIAKTHSRGLKIIFDIVPNHFSSDHAWFQAALASPPGSPERARFHFYDGKGDVSELAPNNWNSVFGGPAWTRVVENDGSLGQWYLHLFDTSQPDLNWDNPEVAADFEQTLRFWFDLGVDGFRIDVAHGLAKDQIQVDHRDPEGLTRALRFDAAATDQEERKALLQDIPFFDREGVHEVYRAWRKIFDSYSPPKMGVAEAFINPTSRIARYVRPDELHQAFNFDFMMSDWDSEVMRSSITRTLSELGDVGAPATWVLNNHDSSRVRSKLGDETKAKSIALLIHALPGGIYIYQGEELGLADAPLPDEARQDPVFFRTHGADKGRDGCRVPLPWKAEESSFGFSTGTPWLPQPESWVDFSVDGEAANPASMLNFYRKSLQIRKSNPALGGESAITWMAAPSDVLSFTRPLGLHVLVNVSPNEQIVNVAENGTILLASHSEVSLTAGVLVLPANSGIWIQN